MRLAHFQTIQEMNTTICLAFFPKNHTQVKATAGVQILQTAPYVEKGLWPLMGMGQVAISASAPHLHPLTFTEDKVSFALALPSMEKLFSPDFHLTHPFAN